jgi:hypothetical protein
MYGDVIALGVIETAFDQREERVLAGARRGMRRSERDFSVVLPHHKQR